ncbi:MAG: DUF2652 domain-containing protein [Cytophagaceae bacterium]
MGKIITKSSIEQVDSFEDVKPAFLYIPDISGYTQFINNTNIRYSRELIHELLEIIVDSNILNLKIAEIQGDAILFYKLGTPPCISKLESQVKRSFLNFQESLAKMRMKYELLRKAPELSLKIIVHFGWIGTMEIKNIVKLLGSDMVVAHRILKNNVKEKEYLLMTSQYINSQSPTMVSNSFLWSEMKSGKKTYDYLGTIHYKYLSLSPLKEKSKLIV